MQPVDQAVREHRSDQPAAAADVEVAVDLVLQAADRVGVVRPDDPRAPPLDVAIAAKSSPPLVGSDPERDLPPSSRLASRDGAGAVDGSIEGHDLADTGGLGLGDEIRLGEVEAIELVELESP